MQHKIKENWKGESKTSKLKQKQNNKSNTKQIIMK